MRCAPLGLVLMLSSACPGSDPGQDGTTDASTGGGSSTTVAPSDTSAAPSSSSGVDDSTSSGGTTSGADSTSASAGSSSTSEDTGSTSETGPVGCEALLDGPFAAVPVFDARPFIDSEDFDFDGTNRVVAKLGGTLRLVDFDGVEHDSTADPGSSFGVRFRANGDLVVAHPGTGTIDLMSFNDTIQPLLTDLGFVNGLHVDELDRVWFTSTASVGRIETDGMLTPIVSGPAMGGPANGLTYDPGRNLLFYTTSGGAIRRVTLNPEPLSELFVTIEGAQLGGMAQDGCGHLYIADEANETIYRVRLDSNGNVIAAAEDLLDAPTPTNLSNLQFGLGDAFDLYSLFAIGTSGVVYQVDVGVGLYGVG